jgi:iron transport multicopper oxidase
MLSCRWAFATYATYSAVYSTISVMASFSWSLFLALSLCLQTILAKTVTYNWTIAWVSANPDGELVRPVIGINGQWPCPTLRASVGDNVVVNVQNQLGNQSTALHWHGLYQKGTAAMDGPVGLTQCAIPPGGSQTYNFNVSLAFPS